MGSPTTVIEVLLAAGRVDAGRLKLSLRVEADPHIPPCGWDRELRDPRQHVWVIDASTTGIDVFEAATATAAADPRAGTVRSAQSGHRQPVPGLRVLHSAPDLVKVCDTCQPGINRQRTPGSVTGKYSEELELLANPTDIQRHLKGVDYPADREELLDAASSEGAPPEVLEALESLPEDEEFDGPDQVMEEIQS
jgi:hypothetical protein